MGFDPDLDPRILEPVRPKVDQLNEAVMDPIQLVQGTLKMLRENPVISMWVQFTSVLPMTVVNILIAIQAFSSVTEPFQRLLTQGGPVSNTLQAPNPGLAFLLCLIVFALKINLIRIIFFTVGSLYQGKPVSIADLFRAQPRLWKGFAIIQSWGIIFEFGTLFMIECVSTFITFYVFPLTSICAWIGTFVGPTVILAQKFSLTALFQVANGVTSFEGTYGLAAIRKAWCLLRGRWKAGLGLLALLIIPRIMADYFIVLAATTAHLQAEDVDSHMDRSMWNDLVVWLIFVIPVIMMSLLVQITVMTWTLFYLSCKAYHHEGFDIHSDNYPPSDYELIGNTKVINDFASSV